MNKKTTIILSFAVLLIVAGGAFYGGVAYGKSQNSANTMKAGFGSRLGRSGAAGAGFTMGTIISKDSSSITLQLPNSTGGSKIIFYSGTTQIGKMTSGTSADLKTNLTVSVTGTTNPDGSVTAQSIQIRPSAPSNPGQ